MNNLVKNLAIWLVIGVVLMTVFNQFNSRQTTANAMEYSEFLEEAKAGVSAGGMPTRVKCLHVLVGHALAAGPGVNPIGDLVLAELAPVWAPTRCTC